LAQPVELLVREHEIYWTGRGARTAQAGAPRRGPALRPGHPV